MVSWRWVTELLGLGHILADYEGYIQTDAYAGYNFIKKNPRQIHLGCWAHSRRRFFDAVKAAGENAEPGLAHEAIDIIKRLYQIEKHARLNALDSEQIMELRQAQAKPILTEFKSKLDKWTFMVTPKSLTGKAISYTLKIWDKLLVYINDGYLPIDNNIAENIVRPFALGRKNWLFNDTVEGAKAAAIYFSIL